MRSFDIRVIDSQSDDIRRAVVHEEAVTEYYRATRADMLSLIQCLSDDYDLGIYIPAEERRND